MLELTWDLPNNVSLLVYELFFFLPWDNAIRQGEQMREEMRERGAGVERGEEDKNTY